MAFCLAAFSAAAISLTSPDGKIAVDITDTNGLSYSVAFNGNEVLAPSPVTVTLENGKTIGAKGAKIKGAKRTSVNSTVASPLYRADEMAEVYNQLSFKVDGEWSLTFRAYNDGVAYRWNYTGKKPVNLANEGVQYNFVGDPEMTVSYVRGSENKSIEDQFFNSFENTYTTGAVSSFNPGQLMFPPAYINGDNNVKMVITESSVIEYPGLFLNHKEGSDLTGVFAPRPKENKLAGHIGIQQIPQTRFPYIASLKGARALPWRVLMVTDNDVAIAQSDLVYLLGEPSRVADTSWIKPGKVAWDWWNNWNIYGVDFESGVNNETYKYYIDFAAKNGIEYVIMDEGWSVPMCGNLFDIIPEIDMPGIVNYANDRGVGIILWGGYNAFAKDMEEVCRHYSEMGVKGFKVDFMDRNDQEISEFEVKAAETAAKYGLVLDLHGMHIPSGFNRTYPNVLNFEGVNGLENLKWSDLTMDMPAYDCTIPFIRQVGGPMDYTQGAMRNGTKSQYHVCNADPMSQGTRCHQLGLYMILDSPLNMLCDNPSAYMAEQESTDFIAGVPTVWDETVVLDGKIGEYIVTARRSGDTWYVGGISNWTPRDVEVNFDFLGQGNYTADQFVDGRNAHRNAVDYKRSSENYTKGSKAKIHMAPGGGFAMKLTKK